MLNRPRWILSILTVAVLMIPLSVFAQDGLESKFSPEMARFINDFKVKVRPTNVEVYSTNCKESEPYYKYDEKRDPDERARDCAAQYAGPLAVVLQEKRAEVANKNAEIDKKTAEIVRLKKQVEALGDFTVELIRKNENLVINTGKLTEEKGILLSEKHDNMKFLAGVLNERSQFKNSLLGSLVALVITLVVLLLTLRAYRVRGERIQAAESRVDHWTSLTITARNQLSDSENQKRLLNDRFVALEEKARKLSEEAGKKLVWQGCEFTANAEGMFAKDKDDPRREVPVEAFRCLGGGHGPTQIKPKNWRKHFDENHGSVTSPGTISQKTSGIDHHKN